jgi:uncharacterized membrane protein YraQ (UPF0718 family)
MIVVKILKNNKIAVLVLLIYAGLFIFAPEKAKQSLGNSVYYLVEMLQVLPVIFLFTVLIDAWIPKETIIRHLGEGSGISGSVFSLLLGSLSAGPIYAAFPLSKMLLKKGASIKNIVIILSSWAVIKVPMLLNEVKFLGAEFMLTRWVLTVAAILIMGYIMALIVKKDSIPAQTDTADAPYKINSEYCIGCGVCAKIAPEHFEMKDSKARLTSKTINSENIEALNSAKAKCPVSAIE